MGEWWGYEDTDRGIVRACMRRMRSMGGTDHPSQDEVLVRARFRQIHRPENEKWVCLDQLQA